MTRQNLTMGLKGNQATTRAINRRIVLNCLRRNDAISRMDLAALTGLSPASITSVVNDLCDQNFVIERVAVASSGGRKPVPLSLNYSAKWSIGIKFMAHKLEATLTDLSSTTIKTLSYELTELSPEYVAHQIYALINALIPDHLEQSEKLIGIGIAMPGFVDVNKGICIKSHRFNWNNVPIASMVASKVGLPVWVDNDVNAYAIAQRLFGYGKHKHSMLAIILGTGVGSAMIINGKIHRGGQSRAGEIGFHKHLTPNNEQVNFNDNYSVSGIENLWCKFAQKQQLPENIAQPNTLKSDHPLAIQFLQDIGQKIGTHLSFLIDFIDPDVVVIGGESLAFNEEFQNTIHRTIKQEVIQPPINIVFDCHDEYWTRGAAVLAIDHFFDFENVNGQQ